MNSSPTINGYKLWTHHECFESGEVDIVLQMKTFNPYILSTFTFLFKDRPAPESKTRPPS